MTAAALISVRKGAVLTQRALLNAVALIFVAGNAIWATGLALPAMIAVFAGCCGVAALLLTGRASGEWAEAPLDARLLRICGLLALGLCLLGGETHLFWADSDWLIRDAVLADVSRHVAPVFYRLGEGDHILRAPVGMYMIPGLVGHWLGLSAAHVALLAQNVFLLGGVLYLAASFGGGVSMALLLVVFGGLDVLPWLATILRDHAETGLWGFRTGVQWWARLFQYSAHVTQIFFVPNHALPGWLLAVLAVATARRALDLATLGAVFAALLLWSPLGPLAAPAWLAVFAWRDRLQWPTSARFWLGAATAACFLPVAFYLTLDAGSISHAALARAPGFWSTYGLFLLVEIPHALFLLALWPRVRSELKPLVVVSVAILAVLPLYSFGPGNDLAMRGSIAPLFLLAFAFLSTLLALPPEQKIARIVGRALVVVGAAVAVIDGLGAILSPPFGISACNLVTSSHELDPKGLPTNYVAPISSAPGWLLTPPDPNARFETVGAAPCWPDHPFHGGEAPKPNREAAPK